MRPPREVTFKWISYALCILLLLFLRLLLLSSRTFLGVMPFLPPLILAVIASLEDTRGAVIFGLIFGVFCDLLYSATFPCLYTVGFTVSALLSALLSQRVLQSRFFCAIIVSVLTFSVVALLNMAALAPGGNASFSAMLPVYACETLISLPLLSVCYPLLAFLHRFFTT